MWEYSSGIRYIETDLINVGLDTHSLYWKWVNGGFSARKRTQQIITAMMTKKVIFLSGCNNSRIRNQVVKPEYKVTLVVRLKCTYNANVAS
jgi:hypothetical protein